MANFSIQLKKISEFEGFNPKEFCIKPSYWGFEFDRSPELVEEAKTAAMAVDGICVAICHAPTGDFVLGESCSKGCSSKFLLFNAAPAGHVSAEVRAITFNTGRGALTDYWFDRFVRYEPGSVV